MKETREAGKAGGLRGLGLEVAAAIAVPLGIAAVLLTAVGLGLAGSPLTQPLEVAGIRTFIRDHVTGGAHPQMLLRLGWPSGRPLPPTPRRPLKEVVTR